MTGCKTTRQVSQNEKDQSGFLGDYSMLQKGTSKEANYVYIDKTADWAKYTKIWLKPVELWRSDDPSTTMGKLSKENQELLVTYCYTALKDYLEKEYQMVEQAGPDVLVIHVAITEARKSKPVIDLVSSVYMPLKVISFGKRLVTGTDIGVGDVQAEADFTDGQTGKRVAAAMDERAGSKAVRSKFSGTWGDVKLSFDWWAQRLVLRLALLKQGDFGDEKL